MPGNRIIEEIDIVLSFDEGGLTFDPDLPSYYVERENRTMTPEQFEVAGLESPQRLGPALGEFWKKRRMPELAALAAGLSQLAGDLREVEEETDEVSPFIYVMF